MIIQEEISELYIKSYSDKGVYIRGGFPEALYIDAIDLKTEKRTYIETDIPIDDD